MTLPASSVELFHDVALIGTLYRLGPSLNSSLLPLPCSTNERLA